VHFLGLQSAYDLSWSYK